MAKQISMHDQENYLLLTAGRLRSLPELNQLAPRSPQSFGPGDLSFTSSEEATAWVATACSRRTSYFRRFDCCGGDAPLEMDLTTWILGAPQSDAAALSNVFQNEHNPTDLRILVHRTPREYKGREVRPCWTNVHRGRTTILRARKEFNDYQAGAIEAFLRAVLSVYGSKNEAVEELMASSGHPWWMSYGRRGSI